jgi:hypothetical protein
VPTLIPLPAFVRLPADVVATSNPIVFGNAREQEGAAAPAADVPPEPEAQVTSSISALHTPDAAIDIADSVRGPPSVAADAQTDSMIVPPLTVHQMTAEESRLPMVTSSPTASVAPRWLGDVTTPANQGIGPSMYPSDSGAPFSVPTTLAPSSTPPIIQTWSYGVLSSPTLEKTPTPHPAPPAQPRANLKPAAAAATLPSHPHSATLQSPASRSHSRPISNAAPTQPPTGTTDQSKQPKKPPLARAPLSTQAAPAPKESTEVSPPKP